MFFNSHIKIFILNKIRKHGLRSVSLSIYLLHYAFSLINKTKSLRLLMLSHRIYPEKWKTMRVKANIDIILSHSDRLIPDNINKEGAAARSIILKQPEITENKISKGVLLISFTTTLPYYYHHVNINKLMQYYYIVLEPSSAGYCDPEILYFCQYDAPIIVESTEILDREFLTEIETNLIPVEFGASDWVDYKTFTPIVNSEKEYDSIYVSNYNPVKRNELFLQALRKIRKKNNENYKAALVCAKYGGYRDYYLELIRKYNLEDMLDLYEGLDKEGINNLLNQSKVNILLSLKEGSSRSLFESMFANTPVIALKQNIGINKDYINRHTGKLIEDHELTDTLLYFCDNYNMYKPRDWALANISPEVTTDKLRQALSHFTNVSPDDLSLDIKTNNPEVNYYITTPRDKMTCNLKLLDIFEKGNFNSDEFKEFLRQYK